MKLYDNLLNKDFRLLFGLQQKDTVALISFGRLQNDAGIIRIVCLIDCFSFMGSCILSLSHRQLCFGGCCILFALQHSTVCIM